MGALTPWLQRAPDGLSVKQRDQIVRRTYDLGRVVKLIYNDVGSLIYVFVNDPTGICIVPIMRKYYSDSLIVVPINSHIPKLLMVVS